jgi:putative component of membrane protein insertase Oxa1/YidC/SpoIIIJ protein YidD
MDFATQNIVISFIEGYQNYISPYNGFCCAHRALHHGASCSE